MKTLNKKRKRNWKQYLPIYLMALPGFAYLIINNYLPMPGLWMAFTKVNFRKGIFGGDFVGLSNFKFLFTTNDAFIILRNTIGYNLIFLILTPICGIAVAIFLNNVRQIYMKRIYQTIILLPHLISMVVVSYLVYAMLNSDVGVVNKIIKAFGGDGVKWYSSPQYWPYILVLVHLWKGIGFSSIVYLSSIVGISNDYFEAAELDGCSKWQAVKYITLPLLKPTVITMTILGLGSIFRSDFGLFYQVPLNQGPLISVTQTLDTYVLRGLMSLGNLGMSAAAGFFQSVVGFVVILGANALVRKVSREDALY